MTEARKLRELCSLDCAPYSARVTIYIDDAHPSGQRHLVARYDGGRGDFASAIPSDWTDDDVVNLVLWPMKNRGAPYPAWEVPARVYGSDTLFRFWAGEAPR